MVVEKSGRGLVGAPVNTPRSLGGARFGRVLFWLSLPPPSSPLFSGGRFKSGAGAFSLILLACPLSALTDDSPL